MLKLCVGIFKSPRLGFEKTKFHNDDLLMLNREGSWGWKWKLSFAFVERIYRLDKTIVLRFHIGTHTISHWQIIIHQALFAHNLILELSRDIYAGFHPYWHRLVMPVFCFRYFALENLWYSLSYILSLKQKSIKMEKSTPFFCIWPKIYNTSNTVNIIFI
jgi:hypothetical protein